jgi:hypothetical protein
MDKVKGGKRIYVAGCFDDYLEIRKAIIYLEKIGFEITYDWTIRAEKNVTERTNMFNNMRNESRLKEEAKLDMNGVLDADWSLFIINKKDYVYRGTFCELGASITRDILRDKIGHTIILSNNEETSNSSIST